MESPPRSPVLNSARQKILAVLDVFGEERLLPATEDHPSSVWVVEDDAPGGVAGYYVKTRLPPHHTLAGGKLRLTLDDRQYVLAMRSEEQLLDVLETLRRWVADGIVTWREGLRPWLDDEAGEEWWRILRCPPDATKDEIYQAFRRQSKVHHPDQGGTHEGFLRLQEAYARALRVRSV